MEKLKAKQQKIFDYISLKKEVSFQELWESKIYPNRSYLTAALQGLDARKLVVYDRIAGTIKLVEAKSDGPASN